jgi:hypothetical protein
MYVKSSKTHLPYACMHVVMRQISKVWLKGLAYIHMYVIMFDNQHMTEDHQCPVRWYIGLMIRPIIGDCVSGRGKS